MEDCDIIELYWARDERAVEETRMSHGRYCYAIAQSILQNPWDSEEVLTDTWLKAWNSIPPQRPKVLRQYLAKITRNLALNALDSQSTMKRKGDRVALTLEELEECVPSPGEVGANLEFQELRERIMDFLKKESPRDQNVFLRRYFYFDEVTEIAQLYDLTASNVLQILSRTRRKLKNHLRKEGYEL